ncbi:MAG: hypothetical protein D6808_06705 [Candidatus Dadabacteria bacterium]|nr:MAG: hypothetical protein D6808_06705 [Candidatus Dadabacteria bacterium]
MRGFAYVARLVLLGTPLLAVSILLPTLSLAEESDFMKHYTGSVAIPSDLYRTYLKLVKSFNTRNPNEILKFCLPGTIRVISGFKGRQMPTNAIDISFVNSEFAPYILTGSELSNGVIMLRTGTSILKFVKTASGWKLYSYANKPIE